MTKRGMSGLSKFLIGVAVLYILVKLSEAARVWKEFL